MMTGEEIIKRWLFGKSCRCCYAKHILVFENETHVVLHHGAHASYVDRCTLVVNCPAYSALYEKSKFDNSGRYNEALQLGYGFKHQWMGRTNKKKIRADCHMIFGVEFK